MSLLLFFQNKEISLKIVYILISSVVCMGVKRGLSPHSLSSLARARTHTHTQTHNTGICEWGAGENIIMVIK
jgi:hypothetical protein